MNTPVSDDELRAPSQAPFILLFSVLMAFLGLVWIMFGFSHREIFLGVVGVIFFVVSFFSMRTGLVILIMAMLFSPEFSIAAIADRSVTLRTEDLLIPVLALAWLAQAAIHRRWTLFQRTPLNRPILFLLLLSVISTMIGI